MTESSSLKKRVQTLLNPLLSGLCFALLPPTFVHASQPAGPSDEEITAAIQRTPKIEQTEHGRDILSSTRVAEQQSKLFDCSRARTAIDAAIFRLNGAFSNQPLLQRGLSETELRVRVILSAAQDTTLSYYVYAALNTVDDNCGDAFTANASPEIKKAAKQATELVRKGQFDQAQTIAPALVSYVLPNGLDRKAMASIRHNSANYRTVMKASGLIMKTIAPEQGNTWYKAIEDMTRSLPVVKIQMGLQP